MESYELKDENKKMKYLRLMSNLTVQLIYQSDNFWEAIKIIEQFRNFVEKHFEGKSFEFRIIYGPRFYRILEEKGFLKTYLN